MTIKAETLENVTPAADVAKIKASILMGNSTCSPLDLAKAIIREHGLELERNEIEDVDGSDVGWWVAELAGEGRDRIQVTDADNGRWGVYSDIEHDGDFTPDRARGAAALLIRAADIADELNRAAA